MDFQTLNERAMSIRALYTEFEKQKFGKPWSSEEIALGFVGDVGDLVKLVMAANGYRDIPDSKKKLEHELADCLWSLFSLANMHDINLEDAFLITMQDLENHLSK